MITFKEFLESVHPGMKGRVNQDIKGLDSDNVVLVQSEEIEVVDVQGNETKVKKAQGNEEYWINTKDLSNSIHWTTAGPKGLNRKV